ncbi:TetR/AcrR family transcriptional regulator (plasmid) [Thioclava sp. 'Guangxiensis']|uniref:TetR/AcrR family transcriptional regulator n=1 Tax=Thioclava sp. 'Guangxiensis' TaxID=3149044 RepID=UPI0032C41F2A
MPRTVAEKADVIPPLAEVFRQHGYEGASIGIISNRTGLGRGSLYHFFPGGKEDMANAVLAHVSEWFEANIFNPLETLPPHEAIGHMLDAVSAYFDGGERICLVGAFALDQTRDRFAVDIRMYFARWITSLESCLERLDPPVPSAADDARRIVATIQGGIVLARASGEASTFYALIEGMRPKTEAVL